MGGAGLEALEDRVATARAGDDRAYNLAWQNILDVRNQIVTAKLIARSAIERDETRGSHYRDDYPETSGDGLYNVFISKQEGKVVVERRPVRFTRVKPGQDHETIPAVPQSFVD